MLEDICCGCGTDLSHKPGDAILDELDRRKDMAEWGDDMPIIYGLCVPCIADAKKFMESKDY